MRDGVSESHTVGLRQHLTGIPKTECCSLVEQGLHVDVLDFFFGEFQEVSGAERKPTGDDHVGKLLNSNIVQVNGLVIELAPVGDGIFDRGNALLQVLKTAGNAQSLQ